jgi:hypothetical protein
MGALEGVPVSVLGGQLVEGCVAGGSRLAAQAFGQVAALRVGVHADHLATVGGQHLDSEQAQQAQAHHGHTLSQGGVCLADTLQRYRPQGGEGGLFEGQRLFAAIWDRSHQVVGDENGFGMVGVTAPGAGYPLAHLEVCNPFTYRHHGAGAGITQRGKGIQAVHHALVSGQQALLLHFLDHLADLVRALAGFTQQAGLGQVDNHFFGADAYQGSTDGYQHTPRAQGRRGNVQDAQFAAAKVLSYLFHVFLVKIWCYPLCWA